MILITGGAWQGKLAFAAAFADGRTVRDGKEDREWVWQESADLQIDTAALVSDGRQDAFETAFERPVIGSFHYFVRRLLMEGKSVDGFMEEIKERNPDVVITADELGCGIVPMDPEERAWREAAGRAAGKLAADSAAVYRMICGIAVRLK